MTVHVVRKDIVAVGGPAHGQVFGIAPWETVTVILPAETSIFWDPTEMPDAPPPAHYFRTTWWPGVPFTFVDVLVTQMYPPVHQVQEALEQFWAMRTIDDK